MKTLIKGGQIVTAVIVLAIIQIAIHAQKFPVKTPEPESKASLKAKIDIIASWTTERATPVTPRTP